MLESHGVARHDPQISTPPVSNPERADERAAVGEGPGGESGVPAAAQDSPVVYVVECGCYAEQWVEGVYSTVEAAMEANPLPDRLPKLNASPSTCEREGGWQESGDGRWSNGLDWDDHATITRYPLSRGDSPRTPEREADA